MIHYDANSGAQASTYALVMGDPSNLLKGSTTPTFRVNDFADGNVVPISIYDATTSSVYQPHGVHKPVGLDRNNTTYTWVDYQETITLALVSHTLSTGSQFDLTFRRWDPITDTMGESEQFVSWDPAHIANLTFSPSSTATAGYYAITMEWGASSVAGDSVSFTATATSTNSHFCHLGIPDLYGFTELVDGYRVNAVSLMMTNSAPLNDRGGQIAMVQANKGSFWFDYVSSGFKSISSADTGSTAKDASKGLFGFLRPTEEADFAVQELLDIKEGTLVNQFRLARNSYLIAYATIANTAGRVCFWSVGWGLEAFTLSQGLRPTNGRMPQAIFDRAKGDLKNIPQFHENPLHMKEIWNSIVNGAKTLMNGAMKYGPGIINGMETIGSLL
jgi:hypothetical protein